MYIPTIVFQAGANEQLSSLKLHEQLLPSRLNVYSLDISIDLCWFQTNFSFHS